MRALSEALLTGSGAPAPAAPARRGSSGSRLVWLIVILLAGVLILFAGLVAAPSLRR